MSDARPYTAAEVEALPNAQDEDGALPGSVLVDREELLATVRALEVTRRLLLDVHDALHAECSGPVDLPGDIRTLRAELDSARRVVAERDAALADLEAMRARVAELAADVVKRQSAFDRAVKEGLAARSRVAELEAALRALAFEALQFGRSGGLGAALDRADIALANGARPKRRAVLAKGGTR